MYLLKNPPAQSRNLNQNPCSLLCTTIFPRSWATATTSGRSRRLAWTCPCRWTETTAARWPRQAPASASALSWRSEPSELSSSYPPFWQPSWCSYEGRYLSESGFPNFGNPHVRNQSHTVIHYEPKGFFDKVPMNLVRKSTETNNMIGIYNNFKPNFQAGTLQSTEHAWRCALDTVQPPYYVP